MIDVSQVLEFSAKLFLLKQLPLTKITHRSTLKLALTRLFGRGHLLEGALVVPHGEHKRGICLRYSSKNYRNLNYSLTNSSFYIMVFNEKICRIKALMLIPLLKLLVCFSITDKIVSTVKFFEKYGNNKSWKSFKSK